MRKIIGFLLLIVAFSVATSSFAQTIDIKANNSDDPVTIDPNTGSLSLTASLDAGSAAGMNADWWVVADTPSGFYRLDITGNPWSWVPGISVTHQGPLVNIPPTPLPALPNPGELGTYRFYVGVETNMNGQLDLPASSGASTSQSTLEADTGMNGQLAAGNNFVIVVDRVDSIKAEKLSPGTKKFFISGDFTPEEKETIRDVITNGPFQKSYGDCTGVSFEEVTLGQDIPSDTLIIRSDSLPLIFSIRDMQLHGALGAYTNRGGPQIIFNSDLSILYDLHTVLLHELGHYYGIGHQDNADGVFNSSAETAAGKKHILHYLTPADETLFKKTYAECNCVNNAGTSTTNYTPSFNAYETCGGGPWIGNWILVNFLDDEDEGDWCHGDEEECDDYEGIGMIATITQSAWVESDDPSAWESDEICAVTYSYSVDENYRYSRKVESRTGACLAPLGWTETGRLEFTQDNKFMIDYFDRRPGDEIVAFKWMRR